MKNSGPISGPYRKIVVHIWKNSGPYKKISGPYTEFSGPFSGPDRKISGPLWKWVVQLVVHIGKLVVHIGKLVIHRRNLVVHITSLMAHLVVHMGPSWSQAEDNTRGPKLRIPSWRFQVEAPEQKLEKLYKLQPRSNTLETVR